MGHTKSPERKGHKEFKSGVLNLQRENFDGFIFCRICPNGKCGFDYEGREIPLEAHHTSEPYSLRHNQDPAIGTLICRDVHKYDIHTRGNGLTEKGELLTELFIEDPTVAQYDIGIRCRYKKPIP